MKVGLACVAKNEDRYIEEWVDYHIKLGFDKIDVYQNDWEFFLDRPGLTMHKRAGVAVQVPCYNDHLKNLYETRELDWVAFLDVDEFLVLKRHKSVKDFLADYDGALAVGINWYFFGNSGLKGAGEGLVKRFKMRHRFMDRHVKSILNVSRCAEAGAWMRDPHCIQLDWFDTIGVQKSGPFNYRPTDMIAQINHYFAKTEEEFLEKIERGRATCRLLRSMKDYNGHMCNQFEDLAAFEFMYGSSTAPDVP